MGAPTALHEAETVTVSPGVQVRWLQSNSWTSVAVSVAADASSLTLPTAPGVQPDCCAPGRN